MCQSATEKYPNIGYPPAINFYLPRGGYHHRIPIVVKVNLTAISICTRFYSFYCDFFMAITAHADQVVRVNCHRRVVNVFGCQFSFMMYLCRRCRLAHLTNISVSFQCALPCPLPYNRPIELFSPWLCHILFTPTAFHCPAGAMRPYQNKKPRHSQGLVCVVARLSEPSTVFSSDLSLTKMVFGEPKRLLPFAVLRSIGSCCRSFPAGQNSLYLMPEVLISLSLRHQLPICTLRLRWACQHDALVYKRHRVNIFLGAPEPIKPGAPLTEVNQ